MMKFYISISLILVISLLAIWLLFRKQKPAKGKFPEHWKGILEKQVKFYRELDPEEKLRFEQQIIQFFHDVTITGVDTDIEELDKLLVASSSVIPLFGFPGWRFKNLKEVLIYNNQFNQDYETEGENRNILGMVGSGEMNRIMILSKSALRKGFENESDKQNVGIHEFVHLLDKADGEMDGIPKILMKIQYIIPWIKLMHNEIREIKEQESDINPYGATNEAEFFSVVSEYFFSRPHLFSKKHPELFELMEKMYAQDLDGKD